MTEPEPSDGWKRWLAPSGAPIFSTMPTKKPVTRLVFPPPEEWPEEWSYEFRGEVSWPASITWPATAEDADD